MGIIEAVAVGLITGVVLLVGLMIFLHVISNLYRHIHGGQVTRTALELTFGLPMLVLGLILLTKLGLDPWRPESVTRLMLLIAYGFGCRTFIGQQLKKVERYDQDASVEEEHLDGMILRHQGRYAWWMFLFWLGPLGVILALFSRPFGQRQIELRTGHIALGRDGKRQTLPLAGLEVSEREGWDGTPMLRLANQHTEVLWPLGGTPAPNRRRLLSKIRYAIKRAPNLDTEEAREALAQVRVLKQAEG